MRHRILLAAKIAGASAALVVAAGLGWMANAGTVADDQPDCPTEDSCTIDYREGGWHIEPDVP